MRFTFVSFLFFSFQLLLAKSPSLYSYKENFNDNSKKWLVADQGGVKATISDGFYNLNHSNESGAALFWNYNLDVDANKDFDISAKLKQLSGTNEYGYGITWGGKDGGNFFSFTISSNGSVNIYKFDHGNLIDILPMETNNGIINKIGFYNELKIKKRGENISFYINEAYVHSYKFEEFFGNTFGFVLNSKMSIVVDDCLVTNQIISKEYLTPKVEWFSPEKLLTITNEHHYSIEAGIKTDVSLNKIGLYINQRLIGDLTSFHKLRNIAEQEFDEIISEQVLIMNGINEVKIVMEDYQGNITESKRTIKVQHSEDHYQRHDIALLFATDEYDNWNDLSNPINDAETIAKELEETYGFKVEVVKNATNSQVMGKIKEYANKKYNKRDQLFVFFAGHGKFDKDFGEGYVVCTNSQDEKNDPGNTTFLAHSNLRTVIDHIPCNHIFLMMDVCFGGTFDPRLGNAMHRGIDNDGIYGNLSKEQYVYKMLKYKTRMYLTSGGAKYVQDGTPGNHSPFVRKVLESLRSTRNKDQILTVAEIYQNVEMLKTTPQFGEFGSNEPGSEFLFVQD